MTNYGPCSTIRAIGMSAGREISLLGGGFSPNKLTHVGGSVPSFKICLMGPVTDLIGKTELDVQAKEGATLSDVFKEVGREYGESVKKKIFAPEGDLYPYVLLAVNGTDIRGLNGIDTQLNEGDRIQVALLITGG